MGSMDNLLSRSINQGYIFYENLASYPSDTPQRKLYENAKSQISNLASVQFSSKGGSFSSEIAFLKSMSNKEKQKEQQLLSEIFGVTITNYDYQDRDIGRKIIEAFNEMLSTKKIYERSVKRIVGNQSKINPTEFLTEYFYKALQQKEDKYIELLTPFLHAPKSNEKQITELLDEYIKESLDEALEGILSSKDFANSPDDERAYKELLDALNGMDRSNPFIKQVYNLYKLDEAKNAIMEKLTKSVKKNISTVQSGTKDIISSAQSRKEVKGDLAEYLMVLVGEEVGRSKGISVSHTGASKAKPDYLFGINIDLSPITKALEQNGKSDRDENLRKIEEGYHNLQRFDDNATGYLIYSNAKSYVLGSNFKEKGFSAGASGTVDYFTRVMSQINGSFIDTDLFFNTIKNLARGAIGEDAGSTKSYVETQLAAAVAIFLFDDFTIDDSGSGVKKIHLLNLNGVNLPLSFLLYLLIQAFEKVRSLLDAKHIVSSIVEVDLEEHSVKYGNDTKWEAGMWATQRDEAKSWKLAQVHFLKSFKEIIAQYLA